LFPERPNKRVFEVAHPRGVARCAGSVVEDDVQGVGRSTNRKTTSGRLNDDRTRHTLADTLREYVLVCERPATVAKQTLPSPRRTKAHPQDLALGEGIRQLGRAHRARQWVRKYSDRKGAISSVIWRRGLGAIRSNATRLSAAITLSPALSLVGVLHDRTLLQKAGKTERWHDLTDPDVLLEVLRAFSFVPVTDQET
jgi:hypothetical protein